MKKGFTLIELIVVIGIIMVLAASLLVVSGGITESARASKCQANMRSLSQACYSIALADKYKRYPHAGSTEYVTMEEVNHRYQKFYGENKGWISWLSNTTQDGDSYYRNKPTSHRSNQYAGCFADNNDVNYALTNGAVWRAVGGNTSCYKCPTMIRKCKSLKKGGGREMAWSYVMNAAFRYDWSHGGDTTDTPVSGKTAGSMKRADRTLLFAEINLDDLGSGANGDYTGDCVLEYDSESGGNRERIGFNHALKNTICAHVTFADGHAERIVMPKGGGDLYELTKWLCEGYDVLYKNGQYSYDERSVAEE